MEDLDVGMEKITIIIIKRFRTGSLEYFWSERTKQETRTRHERRTKHTILAVLNGEEAKEIVNRKFLWRTHHRYLKKIYKEVEETVRLSRIADAARQKRVEELEAGYIERTRSRIH